MKLSSFCRSLLYHGRFLSVNATVVFLCKVPKPFILMSRFSYRRLSRFSSKYLLPFYFGKKKNCFSLSRTVSV